LVFDTCRRARHPQPNVTRFPLDSRHSNNTVADAQTYFRNRGRYAVTVATPKLPGRCLRHTAKRAMDSTIFGAEFGERFAGLYTTHSARSGRRLRSIIIAFSTRTICFWRTNNCTATSLRRSQNRCTLFTAQWPRSLYGAVIERSEIASLVAIGFWLSKIFFSTPADLFKIVICLEFRNVFARTRERVRSLSHKRALAYVKSCPLRYAENV